ncbi:MAG TPA: glycosyltransferase family 8 protein [Rubellimicrobium sp.]|nr:glycosyltransferase family 8 protein [Rubellimicrobium sp.]
MASTAPAEAIEVVCATDEAYIPHLSALLKSIECNKGTESVRVHLICDTVGDDLIRALAESVPALTLRTYDVSRHKALELPPVLQVSRATYLRLVMDEVLDPDIERVIFLDADMIVTTSLRTLWRSDLKGDAVGAVLDPGIDPDDFARRHDLGGSGAYFNAGMLVVDMRREREGAVFSRALDRLLAAPGSFEFADQDALNLVLWQHWAVLDPAWNFQRKFLYEDYRHHSPREPEGSLPKIIHFTEEMKPWRAEEWHPYEWLYWHYLRLTPFFHSVTSQERISAPRLLKSRVRYLSRNLRRRG